ncbi:MAG: VOC family protein [Pseudomonadota bacterium]
MAERENPSILSHVSIGVRDVDKSAAFYDVVLATIGARRVMEHPGAVAYGRGFPEFWVQLPIDGRPAAVANGSHFSFTAGSKAQVDAFYDAALQAGGADDGPPGARPQYASAYYACFVRDPDGHKIEAMFWDADAAL